MENYKPLKVLGEGSFGKVYLMRYTPLLELCCIKQMQISSLSAKEREQAKGEVKLMRRLTHPNIVGYRDSFLNRGKEFLCIVMEYCDGGDLSGMIEQRQKMGNKLMEESAIIHYFVQMTLGLHYMHTHRVLHRDLKTQNIFLTGNGRLVLGDLGISKVMTGTQDFARTCIGTPYYMSPEIFRNKPYNHKSDIWALGCVLYEMTTLNHAFDAKSLNGLAAKIVKGKYPPIHPNYSENLKQLIATVLSVNPNSRPDLEAILRKPFVKRQVQRFFADVKATNNSAANANPHPNSAANEANEAKLGELVTQLKGLDMGKLISKAAASTVVDLQPTDERVQKRRTTEQQEALKREEERRRNVEAALTRLREERKERQKGKASQPQQPPSQPPSKPPLPVWAQKKAPLPLAQLRQAEVQKAGSERARKEKDRAAAAREKVRADAAVAAWEKQQVLAGEEESRRRKLAIAAENARRKAEEEERRMKQVEMARRREEKKIRAFEELRKDKEELDRREEVAKAREEEAAPPLDGGISPEAKYSDTLTPLPELPVVYSSLESIGSSSGFSATGRSNAMVKHDPFAKASKKSTSNAGAKEAGRSSIEAAMRLAQDASDEIIGELQMIESRFEEARSSVDRMDIKVRYSSDEDDDTEDEDAPYDDDDVDMILMRKDFEGGASDDEDDATLQKREMELENEITMATERCEALKVTLEATKQATESAIRQGILTPAKSRPVVRKNLFREVEEEEEEEDLSEAGSEGRDQFEESFDDYNDDLEESYEELEESYEELEETEDSRMGYRDDDSFAIRRAEAKLGIGDDENDESKSVWSRRAESKAGTAHVVTPRVYIGDNEDGLASPKRGGREREGGYKELADAVSPSARIEDRCGALRRRCEEGLGERRFEEAYAFLQRLQKKGEDGEWSDEDGDGDALEESGEHDEERVLRQLTSILGEDRLQYWSLVDQLLFCEDLRDQNERLKREYE